MHRVSALFGSLAKEQFGVIGDNVFVGEMVESGRNVKIGCLVTLCVGIVHG